jgi:hypothetical protein
MGSRRGCMWDGGRVAGVRGRRPWGAMSGPVPKRREPPPSRPARRFVGEVEHRLGKISRTKSEPPSGCRSPCWRVNPCNGLLSRRSGRGDSPGMTRVRREVMRTMPRIGRLERIVGNDTSLDYHERTNSRMEVAIVASDRISGDATDGMRRLPAPSRAPTSSGEYLVPGVRR